MTTTDFDLWLDEVDLETTEEIYSLHESVSLMRSDGLWNLSSKDDKVFIKADHTQNTLLISSDKAKNEFLKKIKKQYMNDTSDVESWHGYQRNMDNPKA